MTNQALKNFMVIVYEAFQTRPSTISVEHVVNMAERAAALEDSNLCCDTHDHRRLCEAAELLCPE